MSTERAPSNMAGVTLIELIIAMVIVGAALAGLVAVYNRANIASADPLVTQQMLAVAETMMEEIMQKPFTGADPGRPASRTLYDEIGDYNGYAQTGIVNVNGDPVAGLGNYTVKVVVDRPGDPGVPAITGINTGDARRIRVDVGAPGALPISLTGWRTRP